jgi:hypothetical protein
MTHVFFEVGVFDKVFLWYKLFLGRAEILVVCFLQPSFSVTPIVAQYAKSGLGRLKVKVSRSQTIRQQTQQDSLNEWSARRVGRYLHNTKQIQRTNILTLSGIPTLSTSNRAAADIRLRPHGHRTEPKYSPNYSRLP